jgi:hypothetical protein
MTTANKLDSENGFIVVADNYKGGFGIHKEWLGYKFVGEFSIDRNEAKRWAGENLEVREITRDEYEFKKGLPMIEIPGNRFFEYAS